MVTIGYFMSVMTGFGLFLAAAISHFHFKNSGLLPAVTAVSATAVTPVCWYGLFLNGLTIAGVTTFIGTWLLFITGMILSRKKNSAKLKPWARAAMWISWVWVMAGGLVVHLLSLIFRLPTVAWVTIIAVIITIIVMRRINRRKQPASA